MNLIKPPIKLMDDIIEKMSMPSGQSHLMLRGDDLYEVRSLKSDSCIHASAKALNISLLVSYIVKLVRVNVNPKTLREWLPLQGRFKLLIDQYTLAVASTNLPCGESVLSKLDEELCNIKFASNLIQLTSDVLKQSSLVSSYKEERYLRLRAYHHSLCVHFDKINSAKDLEAHLIVEIGEILQQLESEEPNPSILHLEKLFEITCDIVQKTLPDIFLDIVGELASNKEVLDKHCEILDEFMCKILIGTKPIATPLSKLGNTDWINSLQISVKTYLSKPSYYYNYMLKTIFGFEVSHHIKLREMYHKYNLAQEHLSIAHLKQLLEGSSSLCHFHFISYHLSRQIEQIESTIIGESPIIDSEYLQHLKFLRTACENSIPFSHHKSEDVESTVNNIIKNLKQLDDKQVIILEFAKQSHATFLTLKKIDGENIQLTYYDSGGIPNLKKDFITPANDGIHERFLNIKFPPFNIAVNESNFRENIKQILDLERNERDPTRFCDILQNFFGMGVMGAETKRSSNKCCSYDGLNEVFKDIVPEPHYERNRCDFRNVLKSEIKIIADEILWQHGDEPDFRVIIQVNKMLLQELEQIGLSPSEKRPAEYDDEIIPSSKRKNLDK